MEPQIVSEYELGGTVYTIKQTMVRSRRHSGIRWMYYIDGKKVDSDSFQKARAFAFDAYRFA